MKIVIEEVTIRIIKKKKIVLTIVKRKHQYLGYIQKGEKYHLLEISCKEKLWEISCLIGRRHSLLNKRKWLNALAFIVENTCNFDDYLPFGPNRWGRGSSALRVMTLYCGHDHCCGCGRYYHDQKCGWQVQTAGYWPHITR